MQRSRFNPVRASRSQAGPYANIVPQISSEIRHLIAKAMQFEQGAGVEFYRIVTMLRELPKW